MDFSLQLQGCFKLAGNCGTDAFGNKNYIIVFRKRNVFQLGKRSFYCQFYDRFQFRWGAAVEGVDVLAVVKADDFITVSGKTAQNIVAAESNQRFTDRCFAAAKLFYQFFFV